MKRATLIVHGLIALIWVGMAGWYGLHIALSGAQESAAGKAAARDRDEARALRAEQQRLRDQLEWEAAPRSLHEAIGVLELPLVGADGRSLMVVGESGRLPRLPASGPRRNIP